ncbi:MAG: DUF1501 domain-containing protein [Planctomycetota bacterium]
MPTPTTRRAFLSSGLTMLAAGVTVPSFINRTAFAVGDPFGQKGVAVDSGTDGKILVVVQLSGGNDGLNTVVPVGDDAYHAARPMLRFGPDQVLRISDYVGLHPSLEPLKALFDDGRMGIVQGVGYPNPNRSHFTSMDIWHSATPGEAAKSSGWLGRFFDSQCAGTGANNQAAGIEQSIDPQIGVSLGESNRLAMQGEQVTALSFENPADYRYKGPDADAMAALQLGQAGGDELDFLTRTAMDARVSSDKVLDAIQGHTPPKDYPRGEFGDGLRTTAAMIRGKLPTRVYYVSLGGFDTHANQLNSHARLMQQFAQGIDAFLADLRQQGNSERVAVMTFSEFGRRVQQNASGGTDHGAAAPMFFFGDRVTPGLLGRHPSLVQLDNGDLAYTVDFRQCYAAVLQQWLDTSP